jgi:hypothetical protein
VTRLTGNNYKQHGGLCTIDWDGVIREGCLEEGREIACFKGVSSSVWGQLRSSFREDAGSQEEAKQAET